MIWELGLKGIQVREKNVRGKKRSVFANAYVKVDLAID